MDYKLTDNREEGATTTVSQSFDYDEENRVARITENYHSTDEYSYKDNGTEIYTFDYTIANEVSKGRRPIHTPRKDVSLPCYPSIPIPLPAA